MSMKKILFRLVCGAAALATVGCTNFLETESPSVVDRDFVVTNEDSARAALYYGYDLFHRNRNVHSVGYLWCPAWGSDIEDAQGEILNNPVYIALNLCRVLAYKRDGLILSKKEGAEWGLSHLPEKYHALISQALCEYTADEAKEWNKKDAGEYAAYMLEAIRDSTES